MCTRVNPFLSAYASWRCVIGFTLPHKINRPPFSSYTFFGCFMLNPNISGRTAANPEQPAIRCRSPFSLNCFPALAKSSSDVASTTKTPSWALMAFGYVFHTGQSVWREINFLTEDTCTGSTECFPKIESATGTPSM